jgi:hypothetical protein
MPNHEVPKYAKERRMREKNACVPHWTIHARPMQNRPTLAAQEDAARGNSPAAAAGRAVRWQSFGANGSD